MKLKVNNNKIEKAIEAVVKHITDHGFAHLEFKADYADMEKKIITYLFGEGFKIFSVFPNLVEVSPIFLTKPNWLSNINRVTNEHGVLSNQYYVVGHLAIEISSTDNETWKQNYTTVITKEDY